MQPTFTEIQSAHDRLGHTLGWRFLTCPERNLSEAATALITINPGGAEFEPPAWSVENGSAYAVESWKGCQPGQENLQRQVCRMFEVLNVSPAAVLSGYLVPFRSRSWAELNSQKKSLEFGISLWRRILPHLPVQTIIAFGKEAGPYVADILNARHTDCVPAGWGDQTIDRYQFNANGRLIVLPHLSRYSLFGRSASEECFRAVVGAQSGQHNQTGQVRTTRALGDDGVIRVLVRANPKIGKSQLRFDCYTDGMTVGEYSNEVARRLGSEEARKCKADIKWDTERNYIRIIRNP